MSIHALTSLFKEMWLLHCQGKGNNQSVAALRSQPPSLGNHTAYKSGEFESLQFWHICENRSVYRNKECILTMLQNAFCQRWHYLPAVDAACVGAPAAALHLAWQPGSMRRSPGPVGRELRRVFNAPCRSQVLGQSKISLILA